MDLHKCDKHFLTRCVAVRYCDTSDCDDVLANTHADGTDDQERPTAEPLNTPHARKSHENIDNVRRNGDEERVGDTGILEERRAEVENEVDTGELLPCLESHARADAETDLVRLADLEAVEVSRTTEPTNLN